MAVHLPPLPAEHSAQATALARILGAIEEYVYTGEFLDGGAYRVVFAGPCREQFLGMSAEDARTAVWADYVHPDDSVDFDAAHDATRQTGCLDIEYRLIGADGVVRWVRDRGRMRLDDGRRLLDGSILDVTEMHVAREELERARALADHLARTDALTGVANRRSLPELIARTQGTALGVLCLDVDRFKVINDYYGHAVGDAVLVELAGRLRRMLRPDDRIVRMGGEEFLLLLGGVDEEANLLERSEELRRAVGATPFEVAGESLAVTVSIGAAFAQAEREFDALLMRADALLYRAKRAGRDRVHIAGPEDDDTGLDEDECDALRLAHALAPAAAAAEGMPTDHPTAVALLAVRIARRMNAAPAEVLRCRVAGLLHDIGKLQIGGAIFAKPGALAPHEREMIHQHPENGERLLATIPELAPAAHIVRHHHERYDGDGYPDGLAGEAIPLEARIIAAVDSFNAMTTDRAYRSGLPIADALFELDRVAGSQLDPAVVLALRSVIDPA